MCVDDPPARTAATQGVKAEAEAEAEATQEAAPEAASEEAAAAPAEAAAPEEETGACSRAPHPSCVLAARGILAS